MKTPTLSKNSAAAALNERAEAVRRAMRDLMPLAARIEAVRRRHGVTVTLTVESPEPDAPLEAAGGPPVRVVRVD